jgi:predicted dehydrogenase
MARLKIAIIGCGAVTEFIYLPTIARVDQFEMNMLVDINPARTRELAEKHSIPAVADDYREILGKADAAILALPHHLHAPVTIDLLENNIHVLVEKPMALWVSDCDEMIKAAARSGNTLAIGLVRRFYQSSLFVKQLLEQGLLGDITSFDHREGSIYSWKVTSDFMFRKEAGGGVLADTGSHALDMLLWWLGDYSAVEYFDDSMGGVEADCELRLRMQNGVSGVVELSRTRTLRNTTIIQGEKGTLEVGTGSNPHLSLQIKDEELALSGHVVRGKTTGQDILDVFCRQLEDFADAINYHRQPFISGQEGKRAIELIETCYALRQPLKQLWTLPPDSLLQSV